MKRSHLTSALLGAVLVAGLLTAPASASEGAPPGADPSVSGADHASRTSDGHPAQADAAVSGEASSGARSDAAGEAVSSASSARVPQGSERLSQDPDAAEGSAAVSSDAAGGASVADGPVAPEADPTVSSSTTTPGDSSANADVAQDPGSAPTRSSGVISSTVTGDEGMTMSNVQYSDEASIVSIHRTGCIITFEVQISTAGTYTIGVWDDGEQIGSPTVSGEADSTVTTTYTMGADIGTRAWGYDFVLETADESTVQVITWDFEGSDRVMTQCAVDSVAVGSAGGDASGGGAPATAPSGPTRELARTGSAAGITAFAAIVLVGSGVSLRLARRRV